MVREFSAGGVVLRRMRAQWFVAVIEPHVERPKRPPKTGKAASKIEATIVALPKGSIDQGEQPEQTALREVMEETGVRADAITKLADIKYFYVRNWGDKARVFKVVSFYLLLYRSGRIGNLSRAMKIEVQRAFWLPLKNASSRLAYKGERDVAERALEYIKQHPELGVHAANPSH